MIIVFDNNVVISAAFNDTSLTYLALEKALRLHTIIRSESTFNELTRVLYKPKFDPYFPTVEHREEFLRYFIGRTTKIESIQHTVDMCRDPKDNKFLEFALSGKADFIVSGDKDLLVLNPFQGIPIMTPAEFVNQY